MCISNLVEYNFHEKYHTIRVCEDNNKNIVFIMKDVSCKKMGKYTWFIIGQLTKKTIIINCYHL